MRMALLVLFSKTHDSDAIMKKKIDKSMRTHSTRYLTNTPQNLEGHPGGSGVKNPPANAGDIGSMPGWVRSPGEGNGNLL